MTNCPPEFTLEIRSRLIDAVMAAYKEADQRYAPDVGIGDRVYGIMVYDVLTFKIEHEVSTLPLVTFQWRSDGPSLWAGGRRLRWNKVGRGRQGETIGVSFPRPSRSAAEMTLENRQLTMFGDALDGEATALANWVLCHMGNPRDGLRTIYLAAPIESDGERITGWREAIAIWSADEEAAEFPIAAPEIGLPEDDRLPDFVLALVDDEEAVGDAAR